MYPGEHEVLKRLLEWLRDGHRAVLVTVLSALGASPRQPGSLAAIRDDGTVYGSVSDGRAEEDLAAEMRAGKLFALKKRVLVRAFDLPGGDLLRIAIETRLDPALLCSTIRAIEARRVVRRSVRLADGRGLLTENGDGAVFTEDEQGFSHLLGPSRGKETS